MDNKEIIVKFYTAFSNGNVKEMTNCYHKDITFQDPAFGILKGRRAVKMWEMLLSRSTSNLKISFDNTETSLEEGTTHWTAEYVFGAKKRKITNLVYAQFKFKDGKIIEHIDTFNLWKWSQQALGIPGYLIGWTPYMKNKIQKTTNQQLDNFIRKSEANTN